MVILALWLVANTVLAAWFSPRIFYNSVFRAIGRKAGTPAGEKAGRVLIVVSEFVQIVIAIAVCMLVSVVTAVLVTSLLGFGWALASFLLLQKFASPMRRPGWVSRFPWLFPLAAFCGFVSSTLAIVLLADWRFGFIPIVLWLLLGFSCAEIAIRRLMREFEEADRSKSRRYAIYAINDLQGRGSMVTGARYPFP